MNRDLFIADVKELVEQVSPEEFPGKMADYVKAMPLDPRHFKGETKVDRDKVIGLCCWHFNVSLEEMTRRCREETLTYIRQVTIYLLFRRTKLSRREIAKLVGRDHSTIRHSILTIIDRMDTDSYVREEVERLNAQL